MRVMGKKKRLNRLISKWIKSDLPEERSTVLLLGVTRIPTSPVPPRRPCSLSLKPRSASPERHRARNSLAVATLVSPNDAAAVIGGNANVGARPTDATTPMDRSVDSIGTCSLDVDASVEMSDWSENSSGGTLRSVSLVQQQETRLPSYLSLACTVNGYSTTTNYDPERLTRSRDPSPHRPHEHEHLSTYAVSNNLLSPPNLVPLPMQQFDTMAEQTITHHHQEFYTSTKTMSYISKESNHFTTSFISNKDTVDAAYRNGVNGKSKTISEKSIKEFKNGTESKSFIQQRVERLYGPGALAQGFFVMKRAKNKSFQGDFDKSETSFEYDNHSKSMSDKLLDVDYLEGGVMKQSSSSPALPVLRHLTPEFRAQLPTFSPRKGGDSSLQKSSTLPILKDEVNGHDKPTVENNNSESGVNGCHLENGGGICTDVKNTGDTDTKDGRHFITVLEAEAKRLLALADKAEEELADEGLSEDATGFIRSAAGKARLLVSQKMQQFKGLCTKNLTQMEGDAFPTTNEDLQGFWDMVMLQVKQVDQLFMELIVLRNNNWVEVKKPVDVVDKPQNNKPRKVPVVRVQTAAAEEARKKREAQRKQMIEDRRKAMRDQKTKESIEIFVPETS